MPTDTPTPDNRYDALIVGARVAGAATAMLLARQGLRVLAIDRDGYGSDTFSTHALMRGAVDSLERWGIAPSLRAQVPDIEVTTFHYGDKTVALDNTGEGTKSPLMAPRRTLLDRTLVDAARDAGAHVLHRTRLISLAIDPSGRTTGATIETADGARRAVSAGIVIGADGLNSTVARLLDVPITRRGTAAAPFVTNYVQGLDLPRDTFQWLYGEQIGGGFIPTGDDQFVVFAGCAPERFTSEIRHDTEAGFHRILDELNPEFAEVTRAATPISNHRAWPGRPGQYRKAFGPGWALVGDAGYFKDPWAAHGISDSLRDAELLAEGVITGDLADYERTRDEVSTPLFEALEKISSYDWTLEELPAFHLALGRAMAHEHRDLKRRREAREGISLGELTLVA
ncbi:MAG: NAD(P)/FAD-dependent oxidoreductase [Actinomycetota bacterium]